MTTPSVEKDIEQIEFSCAAGGNVKCYITLKIVSGP